MGKISEFTILLSGSRQVFYPGEKLAGSVILNLWHPMDMRGVRIELQGGCFKWLLLCSVYLFVDISMVK